MLGKNTVTENKGDHSFKRQNGTEGNFEKSSRGYPATRISSDVLCLDSSHLLTIKSPSAVKAGPRVSTEELNNRSAATQPMLKACFTCWCGPFCQEILLACQTQTEGELIFFPSLRQIGNLQLATGTLDLACSAPHSQLLPYPRTCVNSVFGLDYYKENPELRISHLGGCLSTNAHYQTHCGIWSQHSYLNKHGCSLTGCTSFWHPSLKAIFFINSPSRNTLKTGS